MPRDPPKLLDRACPRDRTPLVHEKAGKKGEVAIDRCPKCRGMFLDKNELLHLTGDKKLNEYLRDQVGYDSDSQLLCPHCGGIMDMEEVHGVQVEVCLTCYGLWLDQGEFEALEARENAAEVPVTTAKRAELHDAARADKRKKGLLAQWDRALDNFIRKHW